MKRKLVILLVVLFIGTIGVASASEYVWPTTNKVITSHFGPRNTGIPGASTNHKGIDIGVSYQPCYAVASGTVTFVDNAGSSNAGIYLIIDLGNNTVVRYLHLSKIEVKLGDKVSKGQRIATSGNTGVGSGPHLHFEVRKDANPYSGLSGTAVDPETFLGDAPIPNGSNTSDSNPGSGTSKTNVCTTCGEVIGPAYYPLGDKHYRTCANGHHSYIEDHNYVDGRCKTCGAVKSSKPASSPTTTNVCPDCGKMIIDKWLDRNGINHYKACANGHEWYVGPHVWNIANRCTKCDIKREVVKPKGDSGPTTTNVCPDCGKMIIDKWLDRNGINHYKACANGHEWYVGPHVWNIANRCTKCDIKREVVKVENTTSIFSDLPANHWAYNEVKAMVDADIVHGRGDGTFGTNDSITAEEFLVLLSRTVTRKGQMPSAEGTVFLNDRLKDNWSYSDYVALTKILGAKFNDPETSLGIKEIKLILGNTMLAALENYTKPITREKAANIMGAFVDVKETSVSSTNELNATDWNDVNSIYKKRINMLAKKNIFRGVLNDDGSIDINPRNELTRVEAVALINRLYNVL